MDNSSENITPGQESFNIPAEGEIYPPKFEQVQQRSNIWIRSLLSLALYLLIGYYFFGSRWQWLLFITAVVIIHELGHFIAMKAFGYNDLGIFFIPLLGAFVSGSKREVSQKQSAVILLAGPLPGIIIGIILFFIDKNQDITLSDISLGSIGQVFLFLNLVNLFPVYPLDGGQLLNRVFLDEESILSRVFIVASAALIAWFAWKNHFPAFFLFSFMILLRLRVDRNMKTVENRVEAAGISLDTTYSELPDKDYWAIRNILAENHPAFSDIPATPPYIFCEKEEKVVSAIGNLLQRHLIQDISIPGKMLVLAVWAGALASPWLFHMDLYFLQRFGI